MAVFKSDMKLSKETHFMNIIQHKSVFRSIFTYFTAVLIRHFNVFFFHYGTMVYIYFFE